MPNAISPILSVKDLGIRRSERWLFQSLSFQLSGAEIIQITGENGSGKTSLMRCLCGLLPEQQGHFHWAQENDLPIIPLFYGHLPAVKPELSVLENLQYHPINGRFFTDTEIESALDEVGLGRYMDTLARNLSAGQTRRVGLARLLISDSKCWVLDEPFTALDVKACQWLEGIISNYVKSGGAVLLSSHQKVNLAVELKEMQLNKDMSGYV